MNNAAMSGTHYPLDKEPRGRNEDDDSLCPPRTSTESQNFQQSYGLCKLMIIKAFLSRRITLGFQT